jgi:hypothetical protein
VTLDPLLDAKGHYAGAVHIVSNITARKSAEEALHQNDDQYKSLFDNFLDSVALHQIVLDEDRNPMDYIFLQANEAFEKQTGLCVDKILGKRVTEVIPGIENTPFIEIYGKVAITGESITFEQFAEPLNRYYHINAFATGEGRFCTVFKDITHLKLVQQALRESESKFRSLVWDM